MKHSFRLRCSPRLAWRIAILSLFVAIPAEAANIVVDSFADEVDTDVNDGVCLSASGNCTLRAAVMTANRLSDFDTIQLQSGTYTLTLTTEGALVTTSDLRITGVPGAVIEGDAGWPHRILRGSNSDLELYQVAIRNGTATYGGCIDMQWGDLTLTLVEISGCTATSNGGAVRPGSGYALTVDRSYIHANDAGEGAGIYMIDPNPAIFIDSTISSNVADQRGGGIFVNGGTSFLNNTTLYANGSNTGGGGTYIQDGQVMLNSCTIALNICDADAGSTVRQGCGIHSASSAEVHVRNTVIAKNMNWNSGSPIIEPDDCEGTFVSDGYNLIGFDGDCGGFSGGSNDLVGSDPVLDPLLNTLAYNGGPTRTLSPKAGSPVLDAGNPGGCVEDIDGDWLTSPTPMSHDQRGFPRAADADGNGSAICDIGSVELSTSLIFADDFESGDLSAWSPAP
jgi:CSLREA domain-containing protein